MAVMLENYEGQRCSLPAATLEMKCGVSVHVLCARLNESDSNKSSVAKTLFSQLPALQKNQYYATVAVVANMTGKPPKLYNRPFKSSNLYVWH